MADFTNDSSAPAGNPTPAEKRVGRTKRVPTSPRVTVTVTREIIDASERANSHHCMVSEALVRAVPYARNPISDLATIRFTDADRGLRYTYQTPLSVRDAIFMFDNGDHVEPFSFNLRGGWVTAVHQSGAQERMPLAAWEALKTEVKTLRRKRKIEWKEAADEIGIHAPTLTTIFKHEEKLPGTANVDKIEAWVLRQTGGKPASRVKTQTHTVAGPARMRSRTSTRPPEIVGGHAPPLGAGRYRQFGLRAFVRKPRPVSDPAA